MTNDDSASERCAARVDAVFTQRPRLRGPQARVILFPKELTPASATKPTARRGGTVMPKQTTSADGRIG